MCLGVPGKVVSIEPSAVDMPMGIVSFAGITKEVCFAYTPDIKVGEYVLVHVGFAISTIDEEEARIMFDNLTKLGELGDLEIPQPSGGGTP